MKLLDRTAVYGRLPVKYVMTDPALPGVGVRWAKGHLENPPTQLRLIERIFLGLAYEVNGNVIKTT